MCCSNFNEDWPFYYSVEPTAFEAPDNFGREFTDEEKETSVLGVEACMWSEWVDGSNFASMNSNKEYKGMVIGFFEIALFFLIGFWHVFRSEPWEIPI